MSDVIIICSRPVFFEGETGGYGCMLPHGHGVPCDDGRGPWPDRKRKDPDPPQWDPRPVRLWALDLDSKRRPVFAHLVVSSEAGPDGQPAAHTTACGRRLTWLSPVAYRQACGNDLPLPEWDTHCRTAITPAG
jgi:hypothetical protein